MASFSNVALTDTFLTWLARDNQVYTYLTGQIFSVDINDKSTINIATANVVNAVHSAALLKTGGVISGGLTVEGATIANTTLTVTGVGTFNDSVNFEDATYFNGGIQANGVMNVESALTANDTLDVYGVLTAHSNINVGGVTGNVTFHEAVTVEGATTLEGTATVEGATIANTTLTVNGAGTFNSNINVGGITGDATFHDTVTVEGATTLEDTLNVTGTANVGGGLGVTGTANVGGGLGVTGTANVGGGLSVEGGFTSRGIDDTDATGTVLLLEADFAYWGDTPYFRHMTSGDDGFGLYTGANVTHQGASLLVYSRLHATKGGDYVLRTNGHDTQYYDWSANTHNFVSAGGANTMIYNGDDLTINGNKVWHQGNDGPGSTLDSDSVDGYSASALLSGITTTVLDSGDDLNSLSNGWYGWNASVPSNAISGYQGLLQLDDGVQDIQIAFGGTNTAPSLATRRADSGTFYPWITYLANTDGVVFKGNFNVTGNVNVGEENFQSSDARLKSNVYTIPSGVEMLEDIRPVSFDWKKSGRHSYGFIAQEVQNTYPEIVSTDRDGNLNLAYNKFIAMLVASVKELDEKNKILEKRIEALEATGRHSLPYGKKK